MNWTTLFTEIAKSNPSLIAFVGVFVLLIQKLMEGLLKYKKIEIEKNQSTIEAILKRVTDLQDRCSSLEDELDKWRSNYYQLKIMVSDLEMENKKLLATIETLKENRGSNHDILRQRRLPCEKDL